MKKVFEKGEIGTIIAISVLVIVGVTSFVSSVFLSSRQITSSKAAEQCTPVLGCSDCKGGTCKPENCRKDPSGKSVCTYKCCQDVKPEKDTKDDRVKPKPTNPPAPTNKPIPAVISVPVPAKPPTAQSVPCLQCYNHICKKTTAACDNNLNECSNPNQPCSGGVAPTVVPASTVKNECTEGQTSNQGCGVYTCAADTSRQCKCSKDPRTNSLKWSCLCTPDSSCQQQPAQPQTAEQPLQGGANEESSQNSVSTNQEQVVGNQPLSYCPDGGIRYSDGASCDYGRQTAGNSVYIDKDNPTECGGCVWVKYGGNFPYGQCHYANSDICKRADDVGGCGGICNAACCAGKPTGEGGSGEDYDNKNTPGSSGIASTNAESPVSGAGNFETNTVTVEQDTIQGGTVECIDNLYYIIDENSDAWPTGDSC